MFKRILVPTDGTAFSNKAVRMAARLAKSTGAKLTIFHAVPGYHAPIYPDMAVVWPSEAQYRNDTAKSSKAMLNKAKAVAVKEGVAATLLFDYNDSPADGVIKAAQSVKADVIVMASHGRKGLAALLIGSETRKVLAHSKIPVLVAR